MAANRVSDLSTIIHDDGSVYSVSPQHSVHPPVLFPSPSTTSIASIARTSRANAPRHPSIDVSTPSRKENYHNPRTHRLILTRGLGIRILRNTILIAALYASLYRFSKMKDLDARVFNFFIIVLTAFISMGLGDLVNECGSMIRWSLLARWPHKPDEVNDLLRRASLSSACGVVFRHVRKRRYSTTASYSVAFVVVSIAARLAVGFFSFILTVDSHSFFRQQPELLTTRWPLAPPIPTGRLDENSQGNVYDDPDVLYAVAFAGLKQLVETPLDTPVTDPDPQSLSLSGMELKNSTSPSYTYNLRNFNSDMVAPIISGRTINASVTCRDLEFIPPPRQEAFKEKKFPRFSGPNYSRFSDPNYPNKIFSTKKFLQHETLTPLQSYDSMRLIQQQDFGPIESPCGPRCSSIWAFYEKRLLNRTRPTLLQCNNTLSNIIPTAGEDAAYTNELNLNLPDLRAQLLTSLLTYGSSIFQGEQHPRVTNNSTRIFTYERHFPNVTENDNTLPLFGFAQFGASTRPGPSPDSEDRTPEDLELWLSALLARATAATIAYLDTSGLMPNQSVQNAAVITQSHSDLVVDWKWAGFIVGIVTAVQLLVAVLASLVTVDVIVKDKTPFSLANDFAESGAGDDAVEATPVLLYGTVCEERVYRLCIGTKEEVKTMFPEGWYA